MQRLKQGVTMDPYDNTASERMEGELRALRQMFNAAFDAGDAPRATSLARIIESSERNLEKARIRESKYITEQEMQNHLRHATTKLIEICRRHVSDDVWGKIVDDFLAEGF